MTDRWTDRLSEYLDGELSDREREQLEAHLAECQECAGTLAELRDVVARAHTLEDRPPEHDLWEGIERRITGAERGAEVVELSERRARRAPARRRLSFSIPQLVAASITLMLLSGGTAWMVSGSERAAMEQEPPSPATSGRTLVTATYQDAEFDAAFAQLERVIRERRDQLDPETVQVIEENLRVIDRAIAQAQQALAQDPASTYLNEHLIATMQQKLEFLRRAAHMAGAVSS